MRKAAFVYTRSLSQRMAGQERLPPPDRLQHTYELLKAYGAFDQSDSAVVVPRKATERELLTFHTADYIKAVKSLSRGENSAVDPSLYNFHSDGDSPPYLGMYEATALAVGGSLTAAELVATKAADVAFNIAGGFHHAAPNFAAGFCIFNDIVIAIKYLLKQGLRVAFIDIDAHHADAVQDAFYGTNQVLKISFHEWGRYLYPGTGTVTEMGTREGKGYTVNVPLTLYTDDEIYLWAFREIVPPLINSFKPDVVVSQLGCDTNYLDPLTHLVLTTDGYAQVIKEISQLAPRWIAVGGGSYEMEVAARSWTLAYGIMTGHEWPDDIPQLYQQRYGTKKLRDDYRPGPLGPTVLQFAQNSVAQVKKLVFPYHNLPAGSSQPTK